MSTTSGKDKKIQAKMEQSTKNWDGVQESQLKPVGENYEHGESWIALFYRYYG